MMMEMIMMSRLVVVVVLQKNSAHVFASKTHPVTATTAPSTSTKIYGNARCSRGINQIKPKLLGTPGFYGAGFRRCWREAPFEVTETKP